MHAKKPIFVAGLQLKTLAGTLADQLDRHQDERREAFDLGPSVFKPLQKAECEWRRWLQQ